MKKTKKTIAFALFLCILLATAGCGGKTVKIPDFSEENLTEAQAYAYAAIHEYEINKNLSLLSAEVLLTEDVSKAIPDNIITKDWTDVKDTRAIVLARYGNIKAETDSGEDDKEDEEAAKEDEKKEIEPTLVMAFFLNEKKETVAQISVSGVNSASSAAPAQAAGLAEALTIDPDE